MEAIESVDVRVRALERRQRQLAWCCGALALALAGAVTWQTIRVPSELAARRFVLRDAGGGKRGEWGPVDAAVAETDGKTEYASRSCLVMSAAAPADGTLHLCAPWERYGGPNISMRERTGAYLNLGLDAYTVFIMGKTSATPPGKASRLSLGVWQDGASALVSDKTGRRTLMQSDGVVVRDPSGEVAFQTPGADPSRR